MLNRTRLRTALERDIDRTDTAAITAARKTGADIWKRVRESCKRDQRPDLADIYQGVVWTGVVDAMVSSYRLGVNRGLAGWAARFDITRAAGVSMSIADDPRRGALQYIAQRARLTPEAAEKLSERFGREATRVTRMAAERAEQRVAAAVDQAIREGLHTRGGTNMVREALEAAGAGGDNAALAETLYRTHSQIAYNAGRWSVRDDPLIGEDLWGYEYVTANDDRVREEHAAMDGMRLRKDDPRLAKLWTPNGWNCFAPETVVSGRIIAGSRALYAGKMLKIRTMKGHTLSVTPNHRIATPHGFVAAKLLRHGDKLICDTRQVGVVCPCPTDRGLAMVFRVPTNEHDDHMPATIKDLFDAMRVDGILSIRPRPLPLDFHGDAARMNGKIDVVFVNRMLPRNVTDAESILQKRSKLDLVLTAAGAELSSHRPSAFDDGFHRSRLAAHGVPGPSALASDNIGVRRIGLAERPLDALRIGSSSDLDAVLRKPAGDDITADAECIGQLQHRFAGAVASDDVVEILEYDFVGHVYDLQSATGYIVANNIISSNCRCVWLEIWNDQASLATEKKPRMIEGRWPEPDKGFDFNSGMVFR